MLQGKAFAMLKYLVENGAVSAIDDPMLIQELVGGDYIQIEWIALGMTGWGATKAGKDIIALMDQVNELESHLYEMAIKTRLFSDLKPERIAEVGNQDIHLMLSRLATYTDHYIHLLKSLESMGTYIERRESEYSTEWWIVTASNRYQLNYSLSPVIDTFLSDFDNSQDGKTLVSSFDLSDSGCEILGIDPAVIAAKYEEVSDDESGD